MNTNTAYQHAPIHSLCPTLVTTPDQVAALALQPAMGGQLAQSRRWHMSSNEISRLFTHAVMRPSKGNCDPLLDLGRLALVDTTAQQAANEGPVGDAQLSESRELLASMLELPLEEGVYGISADGNCLFINATGAAMLGYQPEDVIDKNLLALIHHRRVDASAHTPSECLIDSVVQGGAAVRVDDGVFWGKEGAAVAVSYSASPLVLQDQATGVVVVFKRVAEHQQAKTVEDAKARARSEKNRQRLIDELIDADRRRVEFVATLAHELRHPLAPISHGLSLLRIGAGSLGAGQGSTFTVQLPLAAASLDEAPTHVAVLPSGKHLATPARGLRILVVDDDEESARSLAAVLELKGLSHVVAVASEGRQAVQIANDFKPEVAFLDISMPGMDGYEVAQALRQVEGFEKMKLVALTGWGGVRGRARTEIAGFDYHLVKPTKLGAIDALLSEIAASPEPDS